MNLSRIISILFSVVFFIESSSWAYGKTEKPSQEALQSVVHRFNELSQKNKREFLKTALLSHLDDKGQFATEVLTDLGTTDIPQVRIVGKGFLFVEKAEEVLVEQTGPNEFEIGGGIFNASPEKISSSYRAMRDQFSGSKKRPLTSLVEFLIPSAHASALSTAKKIGGGVLWALGGVIAVLAFVISLEAGVLFLLGGAAVALGLTAVGATTLASGIRDDEAASICETMVKEFRDMKLVNQKSQDLIFSKIQTAKAQLESKEACGGSRSAACSAARRCIQNLEDEFEGFDRNNVNNSGREQLQDRGRPAVKKTIEATTVRPE